MPNAAGRYSGSGRLPGTAVPRQRAFLRCAAAHGPREPSWIIIAAPGGSGKGRHREDRAYAEGAPPEFDRHPRRGPLHAGETGATRSASKYKGGDIETGMHAYMYIIDV